MRLAERRAERPPARQDHRRRSLALCVVMTGVLIAAVDTTIVVLALPEIQHSLHIGISAVVWVVTGYLLVITLLATQVGRLGDMYGRVRMYEAGFVVFIVGSALCALSFDQASMVAFRLLQGVGGAFISANSGAVIADLFPKEERGKAYGYNAVGWSIGAVLGIVLGGLIVTYISWRFIFWINVPIGAGAVLLALRVLSDSPERRPHRLDPLGISTLAGGLFCVLWAITELASEPLDSALVAFLAGGVVLLGLFVLVEWRQREPMLDLALFKIPAMSPSLLASFFQSLANFAVLFLVIMYLQGPRALSPLEASLLLVPGYAIGGVVSPVAGRLADRVGPVRPATLGLFLQMAALFMYAQLELSSSLGLVVGASIVSGVGAAFFFPANSSAVMKASPPAVFGISSGMLRTFSNVGMVFSFSMAILIASLSIPRRLAFAIFVGSGTLRGHLAAVFTSGLHAAFYASMALMAVAGILSATRRSKTFTAGRKEVAAAD